MKKLTLMLLTVVMLISCNTVMIENNTVFEKAEINKEYETEFTAVSSRVPFDIEFVQGAEAKFKIVGDADVVKYVNYGLTGSRLVFELDKELVSKNGLSFTNVDDIEDKLKIYVSSPKIEELVTKLSGNIIIKDTLNVERLKISVVGSGEVKAETIKTKELVDVKIVGSGDIEINKVVGNKIVCDVVGSGDIDFDDLQVKDVVLKVVGSGDIDIDKVVCYDLNCKSVGSGDILVNDAKCYNSNAKSVGSGDVKIVNLVKY